jgi:hypothetical protein
MRNLMHVTEHFQPFDAFPVVQCARGQHANQRGLATVDITNRRNWEQGNLVKTNTRTRAGTFKRATNHPPRASVWPFGADSRSLTTTIATRLPGVTPVFISTKYISACETESPARLTFPNSQRKPRANNRPHIHSIRHALDGTQRLVHEFVS